MSSSQSSNRRRFLRYAVGSSAATVAASWLWPLSNAAKANNDLEELCLSYPFNAQCEDYLPGVAALDQSETAYLAEVTLATTEAGDRLIANGLEKTAYLVIEDGPAFANYAISAVCPHLGCIVDWNAEAAKFICPCHGSQFDSEGDVTNGPASRSLSLVTVIVKDDQVRLVDREPQLSES